VINESIKYYDNNAKDYINRTINLDMSYHYDIFLKYLKENGKILDLGCGSGRDSKYFIEKGYSVIALDASREMCAFAEMLLNQTVLCKNILEMEFANEFDGIWACSSLIHLSINEIYSVLPIILNAMKINSILYMSFKYGKNSEIRGTRLFTDMTENKIKNIINIYENIVIKKVYITEDIRLERKNEKWLNVIMMKMY
jgi:SAM-dependent methyltransferase